MHASGDYSGSEIARACGISRSTLYNYVEAKTQGRKRRRSI
jgi:AcrR family transcriptional regulator